MIEMLLAAPAAAKMVPAQQLSTLSAERVVFWIFGAIVLFGALMTVTRKNNIAAVMSLVLTFFGLAAVYAMLYAHFLAAIQVLVYAGAIMVLFIFVVMVLNRDEQEPWAIKGVFLKLIVGFPAIGYVLYMIIDYIFAFSPPTVDDPTSTFGTLAEVGMILFTDYLFAFEAISIVLLVAVVAAVVVARATRQEATPFVREADDHTQATGMHGSH